ncbi:MAG: aspartate kinase [Flavobacterium sp.]|jgi:aspartate kinase
MSSRAKRLLVKKFGGTSVASIEHIQNVARLIVKAKQEGDEVVIVVSAMGHETDRLDALAKEIGTGDVKLHREVDVLLSTGEQITTALLAMTLLKMGYEAKSYTGGQVRIITNSTHTKARIQNIDVENLKADIAAGTIAIVAGFQGVDKDQNITTIGRGGSDTTAAALASVLGASECQIYTDVEGVFTTDPRVVEDARCLSRITFEEMLELASSGSRVLHSRAVEIASKHKVPIRVLSTFKETEGTLITNEDNEAMEQPIISGIAFTRDEAKLTMLGVPDIPGVAARILGPISDANIEVDMIVQNVAADNCTDFTFTVRREDYDAATSILSDVAQDVGAREVSGDNKIAKLSLVGVGMRSHAGVASKMFKVLFDESINIQMISTSEIKISVVIAEKYIELAVRALHSAFDLDQA